MRSLLSHLSLGLLILSAVYILQIDRRQLQEYRNARDERLYAPRDSSLSGISYHEIIKPRLDVNGNLADRGHLMLFVIHRADAQSDVFFWNKVIETVSAANPTLGATTQYWGVCNDGDGCNGLAAQAHFPILGYMDPFQLHALSQADIEGQSLLYDKGGSLVSRINRITDPQTESTSILKGEQ